MSENETLLLRQPAVSADHIAFVYAGDIWRVGLEGGTATRLTAQKGEKRSPHFSPDGQTLAFTANYEGSDAIYTLPVQGGAPTQVTFHPDFDQLRGWSKDGRSLIFASSRQSHTNRYRRLFTVSPEGGFPQPLGVPLADNGSLSPDGSKVVITRIPEPFWTWKRYRGGRTVPMWIVDLTTHEHEVIPNNGVNDAFPVWLGETIYFLSDRNHTMNLFAYQSGGVVRQLTFHDDFDVRSLTGNDTMLAYEQGGQIHLFDTETEKHWPVPITAVPDLPHRRAFYKNVSGEIHHAAISPTGQRALFAAHGDIFTVPAKKGDIRNLTRTPSVNERYPAWSPNGQTIAYFSDASGEYRLMLQPQKGGKATEIPLEPTFYYNPIWSPDGKKITFTDKRLNLFVLDVETEAVTLVDTDSYDHPDKSLNPAWSPDSCWLAYTKRLKTHVRAVFVYNVAEGSNHQLTDGMSDASSATFSMDGKYLYFAASSSLGLNTAWLDMTSLQANVLRSLYLIVLNKEEKSPFAPESDDEPESEEPEKEEAEAEEKKEEGAEEKVEADEGEKEELKKEDDNEKLITLDLENIDQRIIALPLPERYYRNLQATADKLFYLRSDLNASSEKWTTTLHRFDLKEKKSEPFKGDVSGYWLSHNGKKMLFKEGNGSGYWIVETKDPPKGGKGRLQLGRLETLVDPVAEWEQMYAEMGRIFRDYFYDAEMHGVDWAAMQEKYRPFLAHVGHRSDLNYLFGELMGELVVGHAYVAGGDIPRESSVGTGLLGADYALEDDFYRFERIYRGVNWHPELRAPLTEPGINVAEGEFLLAVNGRSLRAPSNIFSLFAKTAGQQTDLLVSPTTNPEDGRTVTVVPLRDEMGLRVWTWIEANRRRVDELSNGRLAYVYMPDTGTPGFASFNRYYFTQLDKEGVVLDERFNGGGLVADYVVDMLERPLLSRWATREGGMISSPNASIFGPKVMIVNEYAGSGGDALPHFFRRRSLGPIVGVKTWGGLVGIFDYPPLLDGGFVSAPRIAIVSPDGEWEVENVGVAPDVLVEMTPKEVMAGGDPQLEKGVELAMAALEESGGVQLAKRPSSDHRASKKLGN